MLSLGVNCTSCFFPSDCIALAFLEGVFFAMWLIGRAHIDIHGRRWLGTYYLLALAMYEYGTAFQRFWSLASLGVWVLLGVSVMEGLPKLLSRPIPGCRQALYTTTT